jgi:16S rRNA U516 pseudouridylate synthase RsuA-like enzyme
MVSERLFRLSAMSSGSRIDTDVETSTTLYYYELKVYQCLHIRHPASYLILHRPRGNVCKDKDEFGGVIIVDQL